MPLMHRYFATFAPGFEGIVGNLLSRAIPEAVPVTVSSGMALFDYAGDPSRTSDAVFFNNVFFVVQEWRTAGIPFPELVRTAAKNNRLAGLAGELRLPGIKTFRVRYSKENQFCAVDKKTMDDAERHIARCTGFTADRLNPDMEFWFLTRREGLSFFAARLTDKQSTEKYLKKGELRPEIVQLLVGRARVSPEDRVILDPFAGHGSIPARLAEVCPESLLLVSDIDPALADALSGRFEGREKIRVSCADALALSHVDRASVDLVVTDPPWGFWDADAYSGANSLDSLYAGMLAEFARVLRAGGRAFVLTGAKREFEAAVAARPEFAASADGFDGIPFRTDILVNGKKSAVYSLRR